MNPIRKISKSYEPKWVEPDLGQARIKKKFQKMEIP